MSRFLLLCEPVGGKLAAAPGGAGRLEGGVGDRGELADATRKVELHRIVGSVHNDSFLMVYLPKERLLIEAAEAEGIPYQLQGSPGATGTDAWAIQLARAGVATGLVSIPLRYMHTAVETVSLEDVANVSRLLAAFIVRVKADTDFTP